MAGDSKTEKATPKKRRDERKKGNVFQSKDIISVVSVLGIFFALKMVLSFIYSYLAQFLVKYIGYIKGVHKLTETFIFTVLKDCIIAVILTAGPVMIVSMLIGIVATGAQTRFLFSHENMKFKFNRMSILQGVKRLFSLRAVVELVKSLIKVIIIGYVLYSSCLGLVDTIPKLLNVDIFQGVLFILESIMNLVINISLVFLAIAFFDYLYQWFDYEKNIKMSKQEIKEEYKHMEGDPQIKGKIRDRQRKMAMQRMMQEVPSADVIIKNPTHFAIALKYDLEKNRAPIVVAKGMDYLALRIIAIGEENNIPITENKPLARLLYETVEISREIPPDCYAALAEIMAWVYTLKNQERK